jgi:hypothetical protein
MMAICRFTALVRYGSAGNAGMIIRAPLDAV